MKTNTLRLLFLFLIGHTQLHIASNNATSNAIKKTTSQTTSSTDPAQDELKEQQAQAAALAFPADMPTTSINEKIIDKIYGAQGLNIASNDLVNIKKCYCYLEFLAKIDKVKNDTSLAQYKDDFKDFLQPNADNSPLRPTAALVASKGWQAVKITGKDITASQAWQLCNKTTICDTLTNDADFIINLGQTNNQLSQYIPNIEQAYSDDTFTKLRLYEDVIQLQALIQSKQRQQYLAQCTDWQNISPSKINDAITLFKKTDFYTSTHNAQPTQQAKDPKTGAPIPVIIPSPLREQIICYFMLMHIQMTINDLIMQKNSASLMTQVSSSLLAPNFMAYDASDFIYINDLIAAQTLIDQIKANPKKSLLTMKMPDDATTASSTKPAQNTSTNATANNVTIQAVAAQSGGSTTQSTSPTPTDPNQATASIFAQLPTTSTYEATIDQIYGKPGLNIATDQLANIKKTYCYLEYLIKVTKVRTDPAFAQYQKTDFKEYTQAGMTQLKMPTQALVSSDGWKKVPVTQDEIVASPGWQNFIKSMICDIYDQQQDFIIDMAEANHQLFIYCPNIESAYATNDFTSMRLYAESIQISAVIQANQKQRYLQQCIDWKSIDPTKMDSQIAAFKKTDFYIHTHITTDQKNQPQIAFVTAEQMTCYLLLITMQKNIYDLLTLNNLLPFLNQASSSKIIPNIFLYTLADYIYLNDFLSLTDLIAQNKANPLQSTIPMTSGDASTSSNVTVQSMHNPQDDDDDEIDGEVVIQKFNLGKAITKTAKSVGKSTEKLAVDATKESSWDPDKNGVAASVAKTNKASADALDPSKNGFDKKITDPSRKGFNNAIKSMVTGIIQVSDDMATGLIAMSTQIVFISCSVAAAFPGSHVDAAKEADRAKKHMNAHKNELSLALGIIFVVVASVIVTIMTLGTGSALLFPLFIATTTVDKRVGDPTMKAMMVVMAPIMEAMEVMTDAFTTGFIEWISYQTFAYCYVGHLFNPNINARAEMNKVHAKLEKNRSSINIAMSIVVTILITLVIMACTAGAGMAYAAALDAGFFGAEAGTVAAETAAVTLAGVSSAAESSAALAANATAVATDASLAAAATAATAEANVVTATAVAEATATQTATYQAELLTAKTAAKQAATLADQTAAKQAAEQAAKNLAQATAKQNAALAEKQAAQKAAEQAAKVAAKKQAELQLAQASEAAAKQAASDAKSVAEQSVIKAGARRAAINATKDLATAQAEEVAAQQSFENGVQGSSKALADAIAKRQIAEVAAQKAAEAAAKATAELTTLQAQAAASQTIAKSMFTATQPTMLENITATAGRVATSVGKSITTMVYGSGTEDVTLAAATTAANNAVLTTTATETAAQAALNAAEIGSQEAAAAAIRLEAATAAKQAAILVAKNAAEIEVQSALEVSARQLVTSTAKNLADQQAVEVAAKQSSDQALKIATERSSDEGAQIAARQLLQKSTQATMERETAEQAAQTAAKQATEQAEKVTALQTQQAADQLAAKQAQQAVDQLAKRQVQQIAERFAEKQAEQAAAQATAKQEAALAEKQAAKIALQQTAKDTETAAQIAKAELNQAEATLATKETEQQVAQLALKEAQQTAAEAEANAAKDSTNVFAQAAAKGAAKKVASRQLAADAADQAVAKTTTQVAEKQASLSSARIAADQAAGKLAIQETADATTERLTAEASAKIAAKQAESDGGKAAANLAAKKTAQQDAQKEFIQESDKETAAIMKSQAARANATAAEKVSQAAAEQLADKQAEQQAAEQLLARSASDLAKKQAVQQVAEHDLQAAQAATKAAQEAVAESTDDPALLLAARQAADDEAEKEIVANAAKKAVNEATIDQQAAETKVQALTKEAQNLSKQAADQAKIASNLKDTAQAATKEQMYATASRQGFENTAKNTQQNLLKTANEIVTANNARIAALSIGEQAQQDGFLKTLASRTVFSAGFIIGQVLNAGFGVFGILGAIAQDEAAADALEQERLSIQSLWRFVEDNKVNLTQSQNCYLDELHKKHQVAVENQAFGLKYYSNFLSSSVNMVQNQIAQALAQQYIQMLTPDSNGLRAADIGATWGLQTQFDYLYPSQGFITTTLGRPDFPYAQEVAQAPLASETHGNDATDLSDNQAAATKLWFNQRAVSVVNQSADKPLNIEIKFRVLYNLNTAYHVGLYLGGNYHDYNSADYLQSIQDQGSIDLDEANLAKMLVLKRDDAQSAPSIGLYEHEGLGWLAQEAVDANILNSASVYHMSANLNKNQLTVSFWAEDNSSAKWTKTTKVTPCDQRTFGVIFSGIAIEWGVVQPTASITQNKTARVASNGQAEADREKASKAQWKQLLNPKFGSMTLQSSGRPALLQGQYLYTTQSTGLVDGQGNPITDYVVFATATGSNVTALGAQPTANALVSLITGNVYNSTGKIITHTENALQTYAQNSSSISQSLGDAIEQAGQAYQQQLLNVTFGSYKLTAASTDAINAGLFIYTCPTTITTKDAYGKPILDYLIMADLVNNSLGSTVGMPPSSSVPGMVSLVTGNVYGRTSATSIDGGYAEITQYTKRYGQLPQAIATAISSATNAYNNALGLQAQAAQATKTAQVNVIASQTFSFTDLMNALPPTTGGVQVGLSSSAPSNIVATQSSISQLQSSAAGTATVEFGGMGAFGLNFGDNSPMQTSTPVTYAQPTAGYALPTTQPSQYQAAQPITQQAASVDQTQATSSSAQYSPITSANMTYEFGDMGPVGLGFGDDTTSYQAPVTYTQPSQTTSYTIPQTATQPLQNQSTNSAMQSAPVPTPPPATVDYSQFGLVGSSGFSF